MGDPINRTTSFRTSLVSRIRPKIDPEAHEKTTNDLADSGINTPKNQTVSQSNVGKSDPKSWTKATPHFNKIVQSNYLQKAYPTVHPKHPKIARTEKKIVDLEKKLHKENENFLKALSIDGEQGEILQGQAADNTHMIQKEINQVSEKLDNLLQTQSETQKSIDKINRKLDLKRQKNKVPEKNLTPQNTANEHELTKLDNKLMNLLTDLKIEEERFGIPFEFEGQPDINLREKSIDKTQKIRKEIKEVAQELDSKLNDELAAIFNKIKENEQMSMKEYRKLSEKSNEINEKMKDLKELMQ